MRLHFSIRQNSGTYVDVSDRIALDSIGPIYFALQSVNGQAVLSPPASVRVDNRDGWWITTTEDSSSPFYGAWANRLVQITLERAGLPVTILGTFRIKPEADVEISPDGFGEIKLEALAENLRRADAADVGYGRGWYASIPWTIAFDKLRRPEDRTVLLGGLPDASRPYNGSNEFNRRASSIGRPGDFRDDGFHEVFEKAIDVCYNEDDGVYCYATHSELYEFDPVTMKWSVVSLAFSIPSGCDILRVWHRKETSGGGYGDFYLCLVAPREEATQNNGSGYYQPLDQKSERCNYAYFFAHDRSAYLCALDDVCLAPVIYRGNNQNEYILGANYAEDFGGDEDYSHTNRTENLAIPFSQYVFAPIFRRRTAGDGSYYQDVGLYLDSVSYRRYTETTTTSGLRSSTLDTDLGWTITPDTSFPADQELHENDLRSGRGYYGVRMQNASPYGWLTLTTGGPRYSLGQGPMIDISYSISATYDPLSFFVTYVKWSEPVGAGTGQYTVALAYVKGTTQTVYEDSGSSVTLAIGTVPTFVICCVNGYSNLKGYVFFGWYDYHGTASSGSRYARSGLAVYPLSGVFNNAAPNLSVSSGNLRACIFSEAAEAAGYLLSFINDSASHYGGRWTPVSMGFAQDFSGDVTAFEIYLGILDRSEIEPSIVDRRLGFPYRLLQVSLAHNVSTDTWTYSDCDYPNWRGALPPMAWSRRLKGESYGDTAEYVYFYSPGESALFEANTAQVYHVRRVATVPLTDQFYGVGVLAVGNEDGDLTKPRICGVSSPVFPLTGEERWPSGQYEGWYYGERHSGRIPLLDNSNLSKWEAIRRVTEVGDAVYYLNRGGQGVLRARPDASTSPSLTLTKKDYSAASRSWLPIENYVTRSLGDVVPADATIRVILGPFSDWNLVPAVSGFGARPLEVELKCIRGGLAYSGGNPWGDPNIGATFWAFKKVGKRVTTSLKYNVFPGASLIIVEEIEDVNVGDVVTLSTIDEEFVVTSILYAANLLYLDRTIDGSYEAGDLVWIEKADDNRWSASTDLFTDKDGVPREHTIAQIVEDATAGDARIKVNTIEPFGVGNLFAFAATASGPGPGYQPWYRVTKVYARYESDEILGGDPTDQYVEFVYVDPSGTYDPAGSPGLQSNVSAGEGICVWITLPPGNRRAAIGNTGLVISAIGEGTDADTDDEKPVVEGDRVQIVYDGLEIQSNSHSKVTARDAESIAKYGKLAPRGLQANRFMDPYLAEIDVNWRVLLGGTKRVHLELDGIYRKDALALDPWDVVRVVDERLLPEKVDYSADFLVVGIKFVPSSLTASLYLDELVDVDDRKQTRDSEDYEKLLPLAAFHFRADAPQYPESGLGDGDPFYDQPTEVVNLASQATAASRPTFETNERNGRPVIRYDGTNDYLFHNNGGFFTNSRRDGRDPGMTVFVAAKAKTSADSLIASHLAVGGFHQFYLRAGAARIYDTKTGGGPQDVTYPSFAVDTWSVWCLRYAPGEKVKAYLDGVFETESSGTLSDMEQGGYPLTTGGEAAGNKHGGDAGEYLILPFAATLAEIESISARLAEKWVDVPAAPTGSGHDVGFDDGHG